MIRESAERMAADLIVMGTHGRTGSAHDVLGSVAERMLRRAPCPVLTVQASEEVAE
jgi:nucleotide-binding universal stress UspA family protein